MTAKNGRTFEASELADLTALASQVAREGGAIAMSYFGTAARQTQFKENVELVTVADVEIEDHIREILCRETDIQFLGEESGGDVDRDRPMWVVDPIDGTTNFAHDIPHFGVSVGLWDGSRARAGVIYNPATEEMFVCDGSGLEVNGTPSGAMEDAELSRGVIATGFPYDRQRAHENNIPAVDAVIRQCLGVRRFGAAALDLAWLAAGRFQGFWEPRLKPWDVVAGIAMVEAVGGVVTTYEGQPYDCVDGSIVAGAPRIHRELLAILNELRGAS